MKRIIGILAVLAFAWAASANPLTATISTGNYDWTLQQTVSSSTAFDTLAATDSSTLIASFNPTPRGYEYILVRDAITGTGSDSVACQVLIDCLDGSGNLLYRVVCDSMTAAAGEAILLPIGANSIGHKYRIKLLTYTGAGTQAILNRIYLYRRSAIQKAAEYRE